MMTMYDLIVLGGGPAGLTATMYAIQKRLNVVMISRDLGGKTNFHLQLPFVERHMVINGDEIVTRFAREVEYLDWAHKLENAESIEKKDDFYRVTLSNGEVLDTRAIIVATGCKGRLLDVPGEREYMMRGLCYSAVSYAQLFIDRVVAVVGCGELALRGAMELALVTKHVTLIAADCDTFDSPLGRRLSGMPHVEILPGFRVTEVKGDVYARSIIVSDGDEMRELEVDAAFVELDLIPRTRILGDLVKLDAQQHIIINEKGQTSQRGIFAAGDVTNTYAEQVLVAIGEGAKAALSAYEYLLEVEEEIMRA
jgi:alkyl hydroperoxide reductase subunit AhpF